MRFTNLSGLPAAWTMGFRRDGRELLVVIVKGTYRLPAAGEPAEPDPVQVPLVEADRFTGEPGLSAPSFETDYAHHKPACDVLLVGRAFAPPGRLVARCPVGLRVGAMTKQFVAVGARQWDKRLGVMLPTDPEPFDAVPLSYDVAWGGTDRTEEAEGRADSCAANPVGLGRWRHRSKADGQPLPLSEQVGHPIESPMGDYVPQALSPIGRNWLPRYPLAGTYDAAWIAEVAPLWPHDFDERYFQSAPPDQVVPYPMGGEPVVMQHLTADGHRAFELPRLPMPITFIPQRGRDVTQQAHIDTIVFEPDADRFTMTWRCTLPLGRSVFDVREVIAGQPPVAWQRARRFPGKRYYNGLAEAVRARRLRGGAG